ncbi:DUF805 domain-containing protein [Sutterella sp.]|uniref:DUF805 domain-containing protein n=1 Tax=Sutterella sp. TaxID=1981025 RepID=UPI0026DFD82A|nr:DUF805 domain-containing protein [Sutterella sp.]MDO5532750.1 DUF805 domain-containing protein [Sutterella sp.]
MFSFQGTLERRPYIIRIVVIALVSVVLNVITAVLTGDPANPTPIPRTGALLILACGIAMLVATLAAVACRLRDAGHSPWWSLLVFLPVVGFIEIIWLCFAKK